MNDAALTGRIGSGFTIPSPEVSVRFVDARIGYRYTHAGAGDLLGGQALDVRDDATHWTSAGIEAVYAVRVRRSCPHVRRRVRHEVRYRIVGLKEQHDR